jgi:hypothetical protein
MRKITTKKLFELIQSQLALNEYHFGLKIVGELYFHSHLGGFAIGILI